MTCWQVLKQDEQQRKTKNAGSAIDDEAAEADVKIHLQVAPAKQETHLTGSNIADSVEEAHMSSRRSSMSKSFVSRTLDTVGASIVGVPQEGEIDEILPQHSSK